MTALPESCIRNVGVVVEVIGDKPISDYTTIDAGKLRDAMMAKGLSVLSVKRTFITIKAIINLAIAEHALVDLCVGSYKGSRS